ncbi:TolC family protein [Mariniblastus fucicola]|uniref:Outer membrane efflux protein n=1 Tax=Mariniblastus fucicola TaxID=980251 RepID=A0A5B9P6T0_9BACT|nr:TolC family protein [Mariniblastus fucicola]QEG20885.1 Outer membrane efflux protein [Mariniblastus fucicola]
MKRHWLSNVVISSLGSFVCLSSILLVVAGCSTKNRVIIPTQVAGVPCTDQLQKIAVPQLMDEACLEEAPYTGPPITISNFEQSQPLEMTLDECVRMALANSKVMQKLGGVVVSSPNAVSTLYDQAIVETGSTSVEAALSAFDAQLTSAFNYNRSEQVFNNLFFGGGAPSLISNTSDFSFQVSKQAANGSTLTMRNLTNYDRNNSPANQFGSAYNMVNQLEFRQPLGRGAGTMVNRIAGPNAVAGQYNGVLISRIRSDISLAAFESSVRDLVRDVENNYWELYYSYRNLDTILEARDSARSTWENRKLRLDNGVGRPDDEAQARQQFFAFEIQAQSALAGRGQGQLGVLGAERNLRRLMGMPPVDGSVIRPSSEPVVAPIAFDWEASRSQALSRRVELRQQKWSIRQRELELIAARQLNKWDFDLVGNYGWRGFGDNLIGSRDRVNGSAIEDLTSGDLDDWQLGFEVNGPLGKRAGHLAVRNAELNLIRARTILTEQERQIQHDLNEAFTEVDRSFVSMKSSFNSRIASQDELEPKRKRVEEGKDQVFFLLDAQQRLATAESTTHRSIADYNIAILNYHYSTGNLLGRFNIQLTEGPWSENAQARAAVKAGRLGPAENCCSDTNPVSAGTFAQESSTVSMIPTDGTAGYEQGTSFEQPAGEKSQQTSPTNVEISPLQSDTQLDGLDTSFKLRERSMSRPVVNPKSQGFLSGIVDRINPNSRR